jgi:hypothetical protein
MHPARHARRSGVRAILGTVAVTGVALAVVAFGFLARGPAQPGVIAPSSTPAPSASSAAPRTGSPSASSGAPSLEVPGLGSLTGDVAFVVLESGLPGGTRIRSELWVAPLDGSSPQLVAAWVKPAGGIRPIGATVVGRQLSPDGRSFALVDSDGLAVIDLKTGASRKLAANAESPAWSPDGTRIAFARWTSESTQTTWTIRPDGTDLQQIAVEGGVLTWSPDGQLVAAGGGIYRIAAGGSRLATWPDRPNGANPVSWRRTSPAIVLAASATTNGGEQRLEVMDVGAPAKVIAREPGDLSQTVFMDPRWNPSDGRVVYLRRGPTSEVRVVDTSTGSQRLIATAGVPIRAEWNPAGNRIIYIATEGGHAAVHFTPRLDGSGPNEGILLSAADRPGVLITDLACVGLR